MPKRTKNASSSKPSATSLSTPIYHRRRRDWRDDQKLIEEIVSLMQAKAGPYNSEDGTVDQFLEIAERIRSTGFESNAEATFLAMWIREQLGVLFNRHHGYNLKIHPLSLPEDLHKVLKIKDQKFTKSGIKFKSNLSLESIFPDSKIRGFALERIQLLHRGDVISYINSLVAREKDSLNGYSATIMDLIHICRRKLSEKNFASTIRYSADEVDLWIPKISLGVEVRDCWTEKTKEELLKILKHTNQKYSAKFLVIICPDDLSDLAFFAMREIERSQEIKNLSVIRIGDFSKYLSRVIELIFAPPAKPQK